MTIHYRKLFVNFMLAFPVQFCIVHAHESITNSNNAYQMLCCQRRRELPMCIEKDFCQILRAHHIQVQVCVLYRKKRCWNCYLSNFALICLEVIELPQNLNLSIYKGTAYAELLLSCKQELYLSLLEINIKLLNI